MSGNERLIRRASGLDVCDHSPGTNPMKLTRRGLAGGLTWTVVTYGLAQLLRLVTSVVVARLLAPELFGIMVLVYTMRTGVDLFTDAGIGLSVVRRKGIDDALFYDTAWTIQLLRGLLLWALCSALAWPLADFFALPVIKSVLPVAALYFVFEGASSISLFVLQKRLEFAKLNLFSLALEAITSVSQLIWALFSPNIWALVVGPLVASILKMGVSHFILPGFSHKFAISKVHVSEIFSFGAWVLISSLIYFLSISFDSFFLAKYTPLAFLGVFSIARSIADLFGALVLRVCNFILFPLTASAAASEREALRQKIAPHRWKFLLVIALGLSLFVSVADVPIRVLYDDRYQDAAWMLAVLSTGLWVSILTNSNNTFVLALGSPIHGAFASGAKLIWLVVGLPLAFFTYGPFGALVVIAFSDLPRYFPVLIGQRRIELSFAKQDLFATIIFFVLAGFWILCRESLGQGNPFAASM